MNSSRVNNLLTIANRVAAECNHKQLRVEWIVRLHGLDAGPVEIHSEDQLLQELEDAIDRYSYYEAARRLGIDPAQGQTDAMTAEQVEIMRRAGYKVNFWY